MEASDERSPTSSALQPRLCIFISSAANNFTRRQALRKSWFQYLQDGSPLPASYREHVVVYFVLSSVSKTEELAKEQAQHGDIVFVDAPEGYHNLWRKALTFFGWLEAQKKQAFDYVMHADDDSFLRLDLLLPLMCDWPRQRLYWGYIWDGTGNRVTAPIRNPANKSHMPFEQYPADYYPPFASGCGFVLSYDLVRALISRPLPDYRLLDPPFGIHLCGPPDSCVLPEGPLTPHHDERVRPYRPLPTFRPDTLVQHYLAPEEMQPYYVQALEAARLEVAAAAGGSGCSTGPRTATAAPSGAPVELYDTLVSLGLLRR